VRVPGWQAPPGGAPMRACRPGPRRSRVLGILAGPQKALRGGMGAAVCRRRLGRAGEEPQGARQHQERRKRCPGTTPTPAVQRRTTPMAPALHAPACRQLLCVRCACTPGALLLFCRQSIKQLITILFLSSTFPHLLLRRRSCRHRRRASAPGCYTMGSSRPTTHRRRHSSARQGSSWCAAPAGARESKVGRTKTQQALRHPCPLLQTPRSNKTPPPACAPLHQKPPPPTQPSAQVVAFPCTGWC